MRRFLALILALAMTLSVVMPSVALAYDSADTSGSSSITEQSSEASSAEASASASSASEPAAPEPEPEPTPEPEPEQPAPQAEPEAEPDQSGDAEPESSGDSSLETDTPESAPEAAPVLRQYTLHSTLKTVDGVRYQVTVAYDDTAEIPKGTRLSIVELNQELSEEEKKRPENKKRPYKTEEFVSGKALEQEIFDLRQGLEVRDKDLVLFTKFLDLELKKDGRTIQPKSAVTVTVETDVVEEGVSDALEVALYNAQATRDWQKERKKLEEEQNKKLKSGKLKEEDAKRFPEKVYTAMLVTNETKKKKGVKLHFETEELSRMGVCAVGGELKTWKHKGEKVSVFGPRSLKADVKSASMQDPKDGLEKMAGFSVELKEKKKPDYDVTFWVGHRSQSGAVETQAAYEEDAGMAAYTLKDGKTKKELLSPGKGAPAAIEAGDKIGLVWDTGFRDRTLEAEQVTLSGLLPKRAQVETNDMLWRYSRPEALNESVQPGDAATLAAYDISIENRGAEYQPEADNPVTVRIQAAGINKHKHLQVWHLGKDDAVEVIEDFQVSGDTISFEADRFSVYLVVEITKEQVLTAEDGQRYKVALTYSLDSGIPANAELQVSELREGSEYDQYVKKSAKKLGKKAKNLDLARAFDISLVDPATGKHYQPDQNVRVRVQLLDEDLSRYEQVKVVHFPGKADGKAEVMDSSIQGKSVEFDTDGFSVYVITGTDAQAQPYRRTYIFHTLTGNVYLPYFFTLDNGDRTDRQIVKDGERPQVPNPSEESGKEFAGWYAYKDDNSGDFEDNPYSFDTPVTQNEVVELYAVYKSYVKVIFHDQFNSDSGLFPIAESRRFVPTEGAQTLHVKISDASATYSGTGEMTFTGWSTTSITVPGSPQDDDNKPVEAVPQDANGYADLTIPQSGGEIHLYPIYKPIKWLSFWSGPVGSGATYLPSVKCIEGRYPFDSANPDHLPVPERTGYTFKGWYAGTINSQEKVTYGSNPLTNEHGYLIRSASDGGMQVRADTSGDYLYLSQDATLYAKWVGEDSASYKILIWKQKSDAGTDTPAQQKYELYESFSETAAIGSAVSVKAEYTQYDTSKPTEFSSYTCTYDPAVNPVDKDGKTVLNVYYDRTGDYTPSTTSEHTLTFKRLYSQAFEQSVQMRNNNDGHSG